MAVTCQYGDNRLQCFLSDPLEPACHEPRATFWPHISGRASRAGLSKYSDAAEGRIGGCLSARPGRPGLAQSSRTSGGIDRPRRGEQFPAGFRSRLAREHSLARAKAEGRPARRSFAAEQISFRRRESFAAGVEQIARAESGNGEAMPHARGDSRAGSRGCGRSVGER